MGAMDELIGPEVVDRLRSAVRSAEPALELSELSDVRVSLEGRRLRDRVDLVRDAMLADLPGGFPAARQVVEGVLSVPDFEGWMIWPVTEVVAARALEDGSTAAFDGGLDVLALLTTRLSSEFAIRDMLLARPERALGIIRGWTRHENEHVRRLASEGTRAFLPWAKRVPWLVAHPDATQGILDALHRDPAVYVRRSVANHLNDLSRIDPALVTTTARGWAADPSADTPWVIRHGLRTLIKKADPDALALVGFSGDRLRVEQPQLHETLVRLHEDALTFTSRVTNDGDEDATVAIDYSIGFQRFNGTVSPKTFKLASRRLRPGESVTVSKTHSFRRITTRTYYPGPHVVTVQANGVRSEAAHFTVIDPSAVDPSAER